MPEKTLRVGLFARDPEKREIKKWHRKLDVFLREKSITVPPLLSSLEKLENNPDIIIVLGGDGAILEAAQFCAPKKIPILGLNLGTVGFLATARKEEEFIETLEKFLAGKYFLEKRMMLRVKIKRGKKQVGTGLVLNEVVIKNLRTVLEFDIFVGHHKMTERPIRGDGVNICTPTGSTAYNLGLGGAVIEPEVECITIKHIAPISLNIRSTIVDKGKKIKIFLADSRNDENILLLDGRETKLQIGDTIEIKKARAKTLLIRTGENHFWESMNDLFGLNR